MGILTNKNDIINCYRRNFPMGLTWFKKPIYMSEKALKPMNFNQGKGNYNYCKYYSECRRLNDG